jgi:hypothetical protein
VRGSDRITGRHPWFCSKRHMLWGSGVVTSVSSSHQGRRWSLDAEKVGRGRRRAEVIGV